MYDEMLQVSECDMDEIHINTPSPRPDSSPPRFRADSPMPDMFTFRPNNGTEINNNGHNLSMSFAEHRGSVSVDPFQTPVVHVKPRSHSVFHLRDDHTTASDRRDAVERLLALIHQPNHSRPSSEKDVTDTLTDISMYSDSSGRPTKGRLPLAVLQKMSLSQLRDHQRGLRSELEQVNGRLVRAVRQRGHQAAKRNARCAILSAVLQALSGKTSVDSRLKFSLEPSPSEGGVEEWRQAMKAVARLPGGVPGYFRLKLWTTLADQHIREAGIDWSAVQSRTLSERLQDEDEHIHSQIIKDLHRTGWDGFNDEKKLKQLLLGYARYNKDVGYCQGFNIIGALILQVVDYDTSQALKVLVFLMDHVLPSGYFDQSLRALSVDMAVLKDLLLQRLPRTVQHLDTLQANSGNEYEPPLTNVFSMHWLLTLFATCLPRPLVFRLWDAVMLDGSEVLLRTAIAIWARISRRVLMTKTADQFYVLMDSLSRQLVEIDEAEQDNLITVIYTMSPFPYPGLADLREKYTWNIQPLSASFKLFRKSVDHILHDESDSDAGCSPCSPRKAEADANQTSRSDLRQLQKQYRLLLERQRQAAVTLKSAFLHGQSALSGGSRLAPCVVSDPLLTSSHQSMYNHLQIGSAMINQQITDPPTTLSGGALALAPEMVQPQSSSNTLNHDYKSSCSSSPHKLSTPDSHKNPYSQNATQSDKPSSSCSRPTNHNARRAEQQRERMRRSKALLDSMRADPLPHPLPIPQTKRTNA